MNQILTTFTLPVWLFFGLVTVAMYHLEGKSFRSNWEIVLTLGFFPWPWIAENKNEVISAVVTLIFFLTPIGMLVVFIRYFVATA